MCRKHYAGFMSLLLAAGITAGVFAADSGKDAANWWQAQRDLDGMLAGGKARISDVVKSVGAKTPSNGQEALFKLCVYMRAGMTKEAVEALGDVKRLLPALDQNQVLSIYGQSLAIPAWDLAKTILEVFAENYPGKPNAFGDYPHRVDDRLLEHLMGTGWTAKQVDEWLAGMCEKGGGGWVSLRVRFGTTHGIEADVVEQVAVRVRRRPQDIEGAVAFLRALTDRGWEGHKGIDLSWMAQAVQPTSATQAADLGGCLQRLRNDSAAAAFYQKAIAAPLTDEDVRRLAMTYQVFVPSERIRANFEIGIREGLAECLLHEGRKDETRRWIAEAAAIREKNGLGRNASLEKEALGAAAQPAAATPTPTEEERILADETKSGNDPSYWQKRAQYYRQRNDSGPEEIALKKGLAIAPAEPVRYVKGPGGYRASLLLNYASLLNRENRSTEAVALLRKEMKESPPDSESSRGAATDLYLSFRKLIRADDQVLWNWLAARPTWRDVEQELLLRMLENANREDLNARFAQAEKLATGSDPSRACAVGCVMKELHFAQRAIPLLRAGADGIQDNWFKQKALGALFESYLDAGDWKRAEAMWPAVAGPPSNRTRIAVVAAKAGAKDDAMRIWRSIAAVNPSTTTNLQELANCGLQQELASYYREMQRAMPSSEFPAKALKLLGAR